MQKYIFAVFEKNKKTPLNLFINIDICDDEEILLRYTEIKRYKTM